MSVPVDTEIYTVREWLNDIDQDCGAFVKAVVNRDHQDIDVELTISFGGSDVASLFAYAKAGSASFVSQMDGLEKLVRVLTELHVVVGQMAGDK